MRKEKRMRSPERREEIKKLRSGAGFYHPREMVDELEKHGVVITRQTWSNKERGKTQFNIVELQVLADIFNMPLQRAIEFFNAYD